MDADRPGVVPPDDAVPPDVVLQSFLDERTAPGVRLAALLAAGAGACLGYLVFGRAGAVVLAVVGLLGALLIALTRR